jgi:hypothetical protein
MAGTTSRDLPESGFLGWHQATLDAGSAGRHYYHSDNPEGSATSTLPFSAVWFDVMGKTLDDVLLLPPHFSHHVPKLPPAPNLPTTETLVADEVMLELPETTTGAQKLAESPCQQRTVKHSVTWIPLASDPSKQNEAQAWSNGTQTILQYQTKNGIPFFWDSGRHLIALHLAEIDRRDERQWLKSDCIETHALFHGLTKKQ